MNAAKRARPFELRVAPNGNGYGLKLARRKSGPQAVQARENVVEVPSRIVRPVVSHVLEAVKASGYKPNAVNVSRKTPFLLEEAEGVRLGLLLLALAPLRKPDRIYEIADYVRGMTDEEAYYWYSKATARDSGRRAQKAFRTLVAD